MGGFCYRDGGQGQVDVIFDFGFMGALAVCQAEKLFGVAKEKLDLKADAVTLQYPSPVFFGVGAEVKFVCLDAAILPQVLYRQELDTAFEALDFRQLIRVMPILQTGPTKVETPK